MVQNAQAEWCQGDQADVSEQKLSGCLGSSRERRHKWLSARHSMECQTLQLNWHVAGQGPGWPALFLVLSFLQRLLLSHLNGGAGGHRDSMPALCPSSLPTSNIFLWLMVQPSFIFPLLSCSCCLYSWPFISRGQKSSLSLQVAGPYASEAGAWTHWGNHLYSFKSHGNMGLLVTAGEGREAVPKGSPHLSGIPVDPKVRVWSTLSVIFCAYPKSSSWP